MTSTKGRRVTIWQIVVLFLSVYVLIALFIDSAFRLPEETSDLLLKVDSIVCIVFLADFFYQLAKAKSKWGYLKWGWIDFISSLPSLQLLRWGRFGRVLRIIRLLRGVRSSRAIVGILFESRAKGTFTTVCLIVFLLIVVSSVAILNFENHPDSNIQSASDALWWSIVTVTTVGYGDFYPVSLIGRIVAALLMISGVGLFGTFTAYVGSFFLEDDDQEDAKRDDLVLAEIRQVRLRLDSLEAQLLEGAGPK